MAGSFAAGEAFSQYFEDEMSEQRSHHATMKAWLPGSQYPVPRVFPLADKPRGGRIVRRTRKISDGEIIVDTSKDWNRSHALILGALAGAAYALVMWGLANLLSLSMMSTVIPALAVGAAIGVAVLGGIAGLLNYVKAVDRSRDERLATEVLLLHPCVSDPKLTSPRNRAAVGNTEGIRI